MSSDIPLRAITSARLVVLSEAERAARYAALAKLAGGRTFIRPVSAADAAAGGVGALDLAIGLYARDLTHSDEQLVGLVAVREKVREESSSRRSTGKQSGLSERLVMIEALAITPAMQRWQPPIRTLLAAVAVVLVATIAHDPTQRTYVACRAPTEDAAAIEALEAIGGRPPPREKDAGGPQLEGGGATGQCLRLLDEAAAGRCAAIVLDLLEGIMPVDPGVVANRRGSEPELSIALPRAIRALAEELVAIRQGRVRLNWGTPMVSGNDMGPAGREMVGGTAD